MDNSMIAAYLYIPGNFDKEEVFKKYPVEIYSFPDGFNLKDMFFIMSRLIEVPYFNKSNRDNEGFVHLQARMLQQVVPSYDNYLEYLNAAQVIVIDRSFIKGKKTRGYAYREPYLSSPTIKQIPIKYTDRLYKRIAAREKEFIIDPEASNQFPYLTKWLNNNLSILSKEANHLIQLVHEQRQLEKQLVSKLHWIRMFHALGADEATFPTRKELDALYKANRPVYEYKMGLLTIMKQQWFASVDKTVGRFHTNLTNMKSELRTCLRYEGQELVSIDIKNSQPYMSILLLHHEFYLPESKWSKLFTRKGRAWKREGTESPTTNTFTKLKPISHIPHTTKSFNIQQFPLLYKQLTNKSKTYTQTITLLLSEELAETKLTPPEVASLTDYINHVIEGTLYEYIGAKLQEKGIDIPNDRKQIKKMIFQTLFTDNRFKVHPDAAPKRAFAELFPLVNQVFELIKKSGQEKLPILLQQIESRAFLSHIAKRISEEKPNLPIFTVHDSIITLKGEEDYVATVIKEECGKVIGVPPTLAIEYLTDESIQEEISNLESKIEDLRRKLANM